MNYIQIMGGLGNQLFQYVFSKYIESFTGKESVLYTDFFDIDFNASNISKRDFSLDKFKTKCTLKKGPISCSNRITDDVTDFDPDTDNTFFSGYWQNIFFFQNVEEQIKEELTIKPEFLTDEISTLADELSHCESVCLHVRRADYLNGINRNIFCELSIEYYKSAVNLIIDNLGFKPTLYVFSDDHEYIKNHMSGFLGCKTILVDPHKDYEDLYLMSKAKHHIIANSTFSLWGALLSDNSDGITIAPKRWFKDRKDPHLYPDNWIIQDNIIVKPRISVIIPAYNVEAFVDRCLKSIEDQTYGIENLEIIIISDASTDNTLCHLESFEGKHPNEVMLVKLEEPAGPGRARNIGINYASSPYITFVDSDDFLDATMLEKMYTAMYDYDCDIVECSYKQFQNESDAHVTTDIPRSMYLQSALENELRQITIFNCAKTSVWGRLYKKSFIDKNNLKFIEGLYYEDAQYTGLTLFMINSYYRLNQTLYFYRRNTEGIIFSDYIKDKTHQAVTVIEKYLEELSERGMLDTILKTHPQDLVEYCTSKAFVDPLSIILLSNLGINEALNEINFFKDYILSLFPNASSYLSLSDRLGIYKLGKYLLERDSTVTQKVFCNNHSDKLVHIKVADASPNDRFLDIIKAKIVNMSDRTIVALDAIDYNNEHLLIKHAVSPDDIISVSIGKYNYLDDQKLAVMCIRTVLNDYPNRQIILSMNDLYYNETDESLGCLGEMAEVIKQHTGVTLFLMNKDNYKIAKKIIPDTIIELI